MRLISIILILIIHCSISSNVCANENNYIALNNQNDSTNINSNDITQSSSTVTQQDTAKLFEPNDKHGSVNKLFGESFRNINKTDLAFNEYHGFSEMLEEFVPAYSYSLGSPGLFNSFSFFGTNPNNLAFSFNGRPLFDAEYGTINPEQFNTEFFENVEVITGSEAVILSDNSSGALLNIQEIKYNTKTPFTRLWFSQGGNEYLSADGIFSQNFAPNLNFTFGFRRQTGNGRYTNSWVDAWNVRSLIRWTPDEKTNISLVEYFTNHGIGLNGGIDRNQSIDDAGKTDIFDENYAIPFYTEFNQRVFRHDLTLSITRQLDEDTTSVISGNIYVSNSNWEIESIPFKKMDIDTIGNGKYMSRYYGANVAYEQRIIKALFLKAGADAYMVDLEKSFYHSSMEESSISAFALAKLELFDLFSISGGVRLRNYNNKTFLSEGVKLKWNINDNNNVFFDFSISERMPSLVEGLNLENEETMLILSEYSYKNISTNIKLGTSFRTTKNRVYFNNLLKVFQSAESYTNTIMISYAIIEQKIYNNFFVNAMIQNYHQIDGNTAKYPSIFAKLSMFYEIQSGRSILRLGVSGKYVSSFYGETFLPQYHSYMSNDTENEAMFDGLKVFASAKLGNAYVKASLENILGSGFYTVPIYPNYGRNFRLSFSWSFLD